jgi:hypothetical protein
MPALFLFKLPQHSSFSRLLFRTTSVLIFCVSAACGTALLVQWKNHVMERNKFGDSQEAHLNNAYHNGQSDVEKLMSRHLQAGDEPVPDEELKAVKVGKEDEAAQPTPKQQIDDTDDGEDASSGRYITPLDVLGG